ncbi:MAG: hypothetical protein JWO09_2487 [Bacteroidetes bacterium]|nr:hypothetical protein [Bacteroidota bacterium]
MKKSYILSCLIALFLSSSGFSQANAYFLNNPVWLVKKVIYTPGGDRYEDIFNYYIDGDTIISSYTYKKIFKRGNVFHYSDVGMPLDTTTYPYTNPQFFLRSAGIQIYKRVPGHPAEDLLFDYNLAVGDTLPMTEAVYGQIITVVAIDSIATPYGFRKRFKLATDPDPAPVSFYLYEGAGSSGGLIESVSGSFLEGTCELLCYSMDSTEYIPSSGPGCQLALEVPALTKKREASIFPNPFSRQSVFEFGKELKDASLTIFDAGGQKVKTILFSGSSLVVDRGELPAGFYYYQLQDRHTETMTGKLVISN